VIGLGLKDLSFFHLITHAIFKSLLFLCAGVFIHSYGETQDIRFIAGLLKGLPISSFYFIVCSIALCGFPFLSGFYSKDLILELFIIGKINIIFWGLRIAATIFTLSYSIRLSWLIFIGGGRKKNLFVREEAGIFVPMSFLLFLSIFAGCWFRFFLIPVFIILLPVVFKGCVFFSLSVVLLGFYKTLKLIFLTESKKIRKFFIYSRSIWFLPYLTRFLFFPLTKLGLLVIKLVDQGWTELLGGRGIFKSLQNGFRPLFVVNFVRMKFYLLRFLFIIFMLWFFI